MNILKFTNTANNFYQFDLAWPSTPPHPSAWDCMRNADAPSLVFTAILLGFKLAFGYWPLNHQGRIETIYGPILQACCTTKTHVQEEHGKGIGREAVGGRCVCEWGGTRGQRGGGGGGSGGIAHIRSYPLFWKLPFLFSDIGGIFIHSFIRRFSFLLPGQMPTVAHNFWENIQYLK